MDVWVMNVRSVKTLDDQASVKTHRRSVKTLDD